MEIIHMSKKELNQIEIFEKLKNREMSQRAGGEELHLSIRQVKRKLAKYKILGAESLIHANRGRPSKRKIDLVKIEEILALMKTRYLGFGPTFAAEKLEEEFKIIINAKTLRNYMIEAKIWEIGHRKRKEYRSWRPPKEYFGEMVQMDISIHIWIPSLKKFWYYIKFIDDATGTILYAEFIKDKSTKSIMASTMRYFQLYGKPVIIYVDKDSVFRVNNNNPEHFFITQYERALKELDVRLIHAHSPQAKGKIENSFGTDQDRLVKEMQLKNITIKEEANSFLLDYYIPKMNAKFAIIAAKEGDLHRPVSYEELYEAFCIKSLRIVQRDWTVLYHNRFFQILSSCLAIVKSKDTVMMCEYLDDKIKIKIRSSSLEFKELKERRKIVEQKKSNVSFNFYKPKSDHPWRQFNGYFESKQK